VVVLLVLLIVALLLPVPAFAGDPGSDPPEILTLDRAIQIARHKNRNVDNQVMETQDSITKLKSQRTYYFPQIEVEVIASHYLTEVEIALQQGMMGAIPNPSGGGGNISIPPQDLTVTPMDGDFYYTIKTQVTQPLSQLYQISLEVKQAGLGVEVSRSQLKQQQETVVNQVKTTYYGILQTQAAVQSQDEEIVFDEHLLTLVERQFKEKTVLKSDLLNTRAQLANAEYEKLKLVNQLASQKEQLNILLGRSNVTPFSASIGFSRKRVERIPLDPHKSALAHRPEMDEAQLSVLQAKQAIRISRSEYIPDLSLALNFLNTFNYPFIPSEMVALGIMFEWDVFDWGRKRQGILSDKIAIRQAQNQLAETRASVRMDVNNALRSLREAKARVHATEVGAEAARESLRITMNKYKEKGALLTDVLQAQANMANANDQNHQARLDVWTARADLEKAIGMGVTQYEK